MIGNVPDVAAPGLTRYSSRPPVSDIGKNPLGEWIPPAYPSAGELSPFQVVLNATAFHVLLAQHEHLVLDNQGSQTVQLSKDGAAWYDFLPSGRVLVLDGHKEQSFWLKSPGGACVILITTW